MTSNDTEIPVCLDFLEWESTEGSYRRDPFCLSQAFSSNTGYRHKTSKPSSNNYTRQDFKFLQREMPVIGQSCYHPSSREQQNPVFLLQPRSHLPALPCLSPAAAPWSLQMRDEQTQEAQPSPLLWPEEGSTSLDQALCCLAASSQSKNLSGQLWHLMAGPHHSLFGRTQLWTSMAFGMHLESLMNFRIVVWQLLFFELLHRMAFLKACHAARQLPDCFSPELASKLEVGQICRANMNFLIDGAQAGSKRLS